MSRRFLIVPLCLVALLLPARLASQSVTTAEPSELLEAMIGAWRLDTQGVPVEAVPTRVRTYRQGENDLTLEWDETGRDGEPVGSGFLGYDPGAARYYMVGVADDGSFGVMLLSGAPSGGAEIRWDPVDAGPDRILVNRELIRSVMVMRSPDAIVWSAYDERWVVSMNRL